MKTMRAILGLGALLFAGSCLSATMAERSPFAQGTWWNQGKAGSGFEIFNAGGNVQVVWYTFDDAGRPVWYTAGGALSTLGTEAWPLLKHRWENGRKAGSTTVGSARLTLRHAELADFTWELGSQKGTWAIQPFNLSGLINESDHSGTWFDPANSGWGLTLSEQGEFFGGGLFTYDAAGEPTWVAGYERNRGTVELFAFNGPCPSCTFRTATSRSVGRVTFDFEGEARLAVRSALSLPMASGVNADGARLVQLSRPASTRAADRQLAAFESDAPLKAFLDAGMYNLVFYSGADFSAAPPAAPATSTTNLQEAGVDESDLVKSNGRHIYTFAHDAAGQRLPALRIARVLGEGEALEVRGTVPLVRGSNATVTSAGLYLEGQTLVSITGTTVYAYSSPWMSSGSWQRGTTNVEIMSLANPELPDTRWVAEIDGHLIASRRIGNRLYVVTRFVPTVPGFYPSSQASFAAANQRALAATPLADMLPKVRINGSPAIGAVSSWQVYLPPEGGQRKTADMILVTAIELAVPRIAQTLAIAGRAETVYVSTTHLFTASSRYERLMGFGGTMQEPGHFVTDVHQLRLGDNVMSIVGSGAIEGYLGNIPEKAAFRLSEHQGRLRAVTGSMGMWGSANVNRLTVLEPSTLSPGLLKTVAVMPNAQRPQPLGKPGELLYGTRFLADRLYAVTFKQIDPLYVIDLANAADPRIVGALEIPGFSDYLHPLPNGLLLGFGKDARPALTMGDGTFAWYQGLQLSLFDVSDAAQPREIQRVLLGKRGSESALLRTHHAFSELASSDGYRTIAFPARIHDGPIPQYGFGDSASYPWKESGLMRFELRGSGPADAQLMALPSLITHTAASSLPSPGLDPASLEARSILFGRGTAYVGKGQFWHLGRTGVASGPY